MANSVEKFYRSLKLREIAQLENRMGTSMANLEDASSAVFSAALLTVAKQRAGAGFKFEHAEEMTQDEANEALTETLEKLGFEDDPADADRDFIETEG